MVTVFKEDLKDFHGLVSAVSYYQHTLTEYKNFFVSSEDNIYQYADQFFKEKEVEFLEWIKYQKEGDWNSDYMKDCLFMIYVNFLSGKLINYSIDQIQKSISSAMCYEGSPYRQQKILSHLILT